MTVLEVGINLGMKNLVDIKYYSSSDKILNPNIRARYLTGLKDFITEVFDDKINVISLTDFEIICYYKTVQISSKVDNKPQPLLSFAIIERGTNHSFVKQHLKEIISQFLNDYALKDIFSKKPKYFKKFIPRIDEILGDLRLKIEDRIRTIFKD